MINVCKTTAISQTLCILPSVPAHFLQLLRDACGSLLKTTRPNFKHFLPTLPHFSDPQSLRLPSAARRDGSEPCGSSLFTESSILDSLRRSRSIFGVVGGTYGPIISDGGVPVKRNGTMFFFSLSPSSCVSWFVMLVARRPLVCAGTLSEDARRAQPKAHRPTGEEEAVLCK